MGRPTGLTWAGMLGGAALLAVVGWSGSAAEYVDRGESRSTSGATAGGSDLAGLDAHPSAPTAPSPTVLPSSAPTSTPSAAPSGTADGPGAPPPGMTGGPGSGPGAGSSSPPATGGPSAPPQGPSPTAVSDDGTGAQLPTDLAAYARLAVDAWGNRRHDVAKDLYTQSALSGVWGHFPRGGVTLKACDAPAGSCVFDLEDWGTLTLTLDGGAVSAGRLRAVTGVRFG